MNTNRHNNNIPSIHLPKPLHQLVHCAHLLLCLKFNIQEEDLSSVDFKTLPIDPRNYIIHNSNRRILNPISERKQIIDLINQHCNPVD